LTCGADGGRSPEEIPSMEGLGGDSGGHIDLDQGSQW